MSVGDKRWEGHPARDSGQAHKPTGTVPGHQGTRIPPTRGRTTHFTLNKHHQRRSKPTLRNTRAHTHRRAHNMHNVQAHRCTHRSPCGGHQSKRPTKRISVSPSTGSRTMPARLGVGRGSAPSLGASAAAGRGRSAGPEAAVM